MAGWWAYSSFHNKRCLSSHQTFRTSHWNSCRPPRPLTSNSRLIGNIFQKHRPLEASKWVSLAGLRDTLCYDAYLAFRRLYHKNIYFHDSNILEKFQNNSRREGEKKIEVIHNIQTLILLIKRIDQWLWISHKANWIKKKPRWNRNVPKNYTMVARISTWHYKQGILNARSHNDNTELVFSLQNKYIVPSQNRLVLLLKVKSVDYEALEWTKPILVQYLSYFSIW